MSISLTPKQISQLLDFPIQAPPPGITPNFVNPESNAKTVYICAAFCLSIVVIAVGFKGAAKSVAASRSVTWGDGMLLFGAIGVISWISMVVATVGGNAFGKHSWDVKLGFFTKAQLVLSQMTAFLYPLWILAIKLAVILMYLEIFGTKRWIRYWSYAGIGVLTGFHVAFILVFAISCRPRGGQDQIAYLAGFLTPACSRTHTYIIMQSIVNLVGDFYLILLPLPAIWSLQMKTQKKIGVSAMFMTGFCAVVAGIAALIYRLKLLHGNADNTWRSIYNWNAAMFEMTAGILVVCMPAIASVTKKAFPALKSVLLSSRLFSSGHTSSEKRETTQNSWPRGPSKARLFLTEISRSGSHSGNDSDSSQQTKVPDDQPWVHSKRDSQYRAWAAPASDNGSTSQADISPTQIQMTTVFDVKTIEGR